MVFDTLNKLFAKTDIITPSLDFSVCLCTRWCGNPITVSTGEDVKNEF